MFTLCMMSNSWWTSWTIAPRISWVWLTSTSRQQSIASFLERSQGSIQCAVIPKNDQLWADQQLAVVATKLISENKWVRADRDARKRSARMDIKVLLQCEVRSRGTFCIFIPSTEPSWIRQGCRHHILNNKAINKAISRLNTCILINENRSF